MSKKKKNIEGSVVSTSPVPAKKIVMLNFADALREVLNGRKVTRVSWENVDTYIFLVQEFLSIHMNDTVHQLIVSVGDIEGLDWFVLPEQEELVNENMKTHTSKEELLEATEANNMQRGV